LQLRQRHKLRVGRRLPAQLIRDPPCGAGAPCRRGSEPSAS
jgi:hypothetical protein